MRFSKKKLRIGQFWVCRWTLRKRHFFKIFKNGCHFFNNGFSQKLLISLYLPSQDLPGETKIFEKISKLMTREKILVEKFSKFEKFSRKIFVHFFPFFRLGDVELHDFFSKKKKNSSKIWVSKIFRQKKSFFDFRKGYILRHPKDSSWRVESNGVKKMMVYFNTSRSKMAKTDFSFSGHLDFCFLKNSQNSK